ncbi:MAG: cbb3-type cytochrome oxidase assembly protein CcoS [Burkholderiales bacterium]
MEILYLLIPLSVVLVIAIAVVFWYALKSGQFDDLEGPAHRILMDDDSPAPVRNLQPDGFDINQK